MNVSSTKKKETCPNPSNPVSLVHIKPKVIATATTNVQISGSSNATSSFSDAEQEFKNLSPSRTSQSSDNSIITQDSDLKKIEQSPYFLTRNNDLSQAKKLPESGSHSKLSDLAHKMSDFLFSTRRSIDTSCQNLAADQGSLRNNDSSNPSPVQSRESSFVSLSSLARSGARPVPSKRRSFLFRPNLSPPRSSANSTINNVDHHNALNNKINPDSCFTLNPNSSNASLDSNTIKNSPCNFSCSVNTNTVNTNSSKVKETHYVHVEYDPVTRKRILNTYEILKDIGAGQHGRVKLAKDLATGTRVAIKIVDRTGKPALMLSRLSRGKTQTQEDKIRKEVAIMKKCDHPHVVKLIEVLDAENSRKIYLVLEYLEKGEIKWQISPEEVLSMVKSKSDKVSLSGEITIKDCIFEPLLSLEQTKKIFRDVLGGLEYLHYQGIIHRDIKPSNLLVSHDDNVKISDFGVSFADNLDGETQDDVELAKTAGTPAFLAPELCGTEGKSMKVTYKIDIWALGVTLYCFIFGCLPFYADSEYQLFQNICHDDIKFPDMTRWRVATPLDDHEFQMAKDLIVKLLDKNPETRLEIEEIKKHPFVLDGLDGQKWQDDDKYLDKNTKIKVSSEEVDDAVVGIGSRIKKRISDAFKRRKTLVDFEKSLNGQKDKEKQTIDSDLLLGNTPLSGLKDDCGYILSEKNTLNDDSINAKSQLSLNLLNDHSECSYNPSSSTTCLCVANARGRSESSEATKEGSPVEKNNDQHAINALGREEHDESPLCTSSPGAKNYSVENYDASDGSDAESYDYRKDLKCDDNEGQVESVQLTVNPSFASLDSFYDDSYSKFINPATTVGSSTYTGFGSFSGRNNMPNATRMPSLHSNRPSLNSAAASAESTHSSESRESIAMVRNNSRSPSGAPFKLPGSIQTNFNNLRGRPPRTKASPATDGPILSSARISRNAPKGMLPTNSILNAASSIVKNLPSESHKNTAFKGIVESDSSSEDEEKPIEFKGRRDSDKSASDIRDNVPKPMTNSKVATRKAYFTSGDDEKDDEGSSNNDISGVSNSLFNKKESITGTNKNIRNAEETLTKNSQALLPTKSSIYGTKLRLVHQSFDQTENGSDSDDSDDNDAELFLSFGKPKVVSNILNSPGNSISSQGAQTSTGKSESERNSSRGDSKEVIASYVSAENILSLSKPTIVDVPDNLFESEKSSLDGKNRNINNNPNRSFVFSENGAIEDELAVLSINQDDVFCDQ